MRYITALFANVFILMAFVPGVNAYPQQDLDAKTFIDIATRTTILEIKTAKLALLKSDSTAIKVYAEQMLSEQHAVLNGLQGLAQATQVAATHVVPDVTQLNAAGVAPWLEGEKFNQAYSKRRLQERKKWVALMRKGLESSDAQVRRYAQATLPVSLQQLYLAQQLPTAPF